VEYVLSDEPLVTFSFVIKGKYDKEHAKLYTTHLAQIFGANKFIIREGSVKIAFYAPFSKATAGAVHLIKNGLSLAGDIIEQGDIICPFPGWSVWSGLGFHFETKQQFILTLRVMSSLVETKQHSILRSYLEDTNDSKEASLETQMKGISDSKLQYLEKDTNDSKEESKILSTLSEVLSEVLSKGGLINPGKIDFIHKLAQQLPRNADPIIETENGTELDIYWEDLLVIGLTDEETVSISDFTSGSQQYKYYPGYTEDAIAHIRKCYQNLSINPT